MRFLKYQPTPDKEPEYINVAQITTFKFRKDDDETTIAIAGEKYPTILSGDWTAQILGDAEVAE